MLKLKFKLDKKFLKYSKVFLYFLCLDAKLKNFPIYHHLTNFEILWIRSMVCSDFEC